MERPGRDFWVAGRFDDADRAWRRALEVDPRNEFAVANRGDALVDAGRPTEGLAKCEGRWTWRASTARLWLTRPSGTPGGPGGSRRHARHATGRLECSIAKVYAFRGQADLAFEWLERARVGKDPGIGWVKTDPLLKAIRGDPRYSAILGRIHLPVD